VQQDGLVDSSADVNRRILIVDDNQAIHTDFRKILAAPDPSAAALDELGAMLFGAPEAARSGAFELDSAFQGREALERVTVASTAGRPYALAFVDMRMPPGWDGLETIENVWRADPFLQVVICSAYSDHSWESLRKRLGDCDGLLIIKKPFDPIEIMQCAHALTVKWTLARRARARVEDLEAALRARTGELEAAGRLVAGAAQELGTLIRHVGDGRYLEEHLPGALDRIEDRITRVAEIILGMK
jgi:CheY-like chemotaxis protein